MVTLNPDYAVFTAALLLADQHKMLDLEIAHDITPHGEGEGHPYSDTHYVRMGGRRYRVTIEPIEQPGGTDERRAVP